MAVTREPKPLVKELCDKLPEELVMANVSTGGLANSVSNFLDHYVQKFDLDPQFVEKLRAIPERLSWLNGRVRAYELGRDMSMVSNHMVAESTKVLNENSGSISAFLPVIHPVHGKEPDPYIQVTDQNITRRFANQEWMEWYGKFNDLSLPQLLRAAASRTVDRLYPTPDSKEGLGWMVSEVLDSRGHDDSLLYPQEIVITRTITKRV